MTFTKTAKPTASFSKEAKPLVEAWVVEYEANELPTAATPAWTKDGAFVTEEISPAGILHIINNARGIYTSATISSFDSSVGSTVEVKLKVVSTDADDGPEIDISDGSHYWEVRFDADKIVLIGSYLVESDQTYTMDTTDDYHVYRITKIGTTIKVYIDRVLRLTGTASEVQPDKTIWFGSYSPTANHESLWNYVYYRTDGVFAPKGYGIIYEKGAKPS